VAFLARSHARNAGAFALWNPAGLPGRPAGGAGFAVRSRRRVRADPGFQRCNTTADRGSALLYCMNGVAGRRPGPHGTCSATGAL